MDNIRARMLNGKPIGGCEKCYNIEREGYISPRQSKYNHKVMTEVRDVELKLRIFGNHCNLGCYMCHPQNSTTRTKEAKDIGLFNELSLWGDYGVKMTPKWYQQIEDNIIENIHRVAILHFTGGEPFLLPKHYSFLERIPDEHKKHIRVTYDTNATALEYKGKSIFDELMKFDRTTFAVSCDHYQDKLAFIRYPIDVEEWEYNVRYLKHMAKQHPQKFRMSQLKGTVSILNVEDLNDYIEKLSAHRGIDFRDLWPDYYKIPLIETVNTGA